MKDGRRTKDAGRAVPGRSRARATAARKTTRRSRAMVTFGALETPHGTLHVIAGPDGLLRIDLPGGPRSDPERVGEAAGYDRGAEGGRLVDRARRQLEQYFAGRRRTFELPLDPRGTPFDRKVWEAVARVPFGEVETYAAIARAIRRPTACRAVGAANGRNPLPIVVPCHRIVGSGGRLTGYGGGLPLKATLLELEGRSVRGDGASARA